MWKKRLWTLLCAGLLTLALTAGESALASGAAEGSGTWKSPYVVTDAEQLVSALGASGSGTVYIRLGADISADKDGALSGVSVRGDKNLDLGGFTLRSKLRFSASGGSLFTVEAGAALTLEDSAGGGEIVYDRYIPSMGEASAQYEIILDRPLSVFDVSGELTVNGGEITAGHYESEYYTFTDGFQYADSQPLAGRVNSVTIGNAVVVRSGGRFTSNGGEFYGRGFVMDDEGYKETACAAVVLKKNATARINSGDFHGKSNADVFSVDDGAAITVLSGTFRAWYDSRITSDKRNGVAYYVNVDCGRLGLPLRAFDNDKQDFTHIYIDGDKYNYSPDYSARDDEAFIELGADGTGVTVTVETLVGNGSSDNPYLLKYAADINELLNQRRKSMVYIRLENDIDNCTGGYEVSGNIVLDLCGHTLKCRLPFVNAGVHPFISIEAGSRLTLEDSGGDGEIIYDRIVPPMGEMNVLTDILLDRPLTVFSVAGYLTVNGGEITAGHYESEYYTYTRKFATGGSTSAQTIHSVTPGSAVVVLDGGRFTSNGGEYYGRGFTINDNGEKEESCAAVRLNGGAVAIINDGKFFGKSNADVFNVHWGANVSVYAGLFQAEYDNRITVDKANEVATYVNVDCGRIGLPLRAFSQAGARCIIRVGSEEYAFSPDFTESQSNSFENLGIVGTGVTVTAAPYAQGTSRLERQDGTTARFDYCPLTHEELVNVNAMYFNDSFGAIPYPPREVSYLWKVERENGADWAAVAYTADAPVAGGFFLTQGARLDLYELARCLDGGMQNGVRYRVTARAVELWRSAGSYTIQTESENSIYFDCVYEPVGEIDIPDSETGIEWPEQGKYAKNLTLERDTYTMTLTFQEASADGTYWATMSEKNAFNWRRNYRLLVRVTPKPFYRVDPEHSIYLGDKRVRDKELDGAALTGVIPLDVLPGKIGVVKVDGSVREGVMLNAYLPLRCATGYVSITTAWFLGDTEVTGETAVYGDYRARITVKTDAHYILTENTTVMAFGKTYPITNLSDDGTTGSVLTDAQSVACSHGKNTNGYAFDEDGHYILCSVCGAELIHAAHTMGNWGVQGAYDVRTCTACGYQESVSNGRQRVSCIRLTGEPPRVGETLPTVIVYYEDAQYASLEHEVEWYRDEVGYATYVPADTVMEAGHVYCCFAKFDAADGYYFDSDTQVVTRNPAASTTEEVYGGSTHLEAVLAFTPRAVDAAAFTLAERREEQTFGAFLAGFAATVDGASAPLALTIYQDGSSVAELTYDNKTGAWSILSGNLDEIKALAMEPDAEYKAVLTTVEEGKHFDAAYITVNNAKAADKVELAVVESGCTVTATYYRKGDVNGDGEVNIGDVSAMLVDLLFGDGPGKNQDVNGDGAVDCLDAFTLLKDSVSEDVELFIAAAYDGEGQLIEARLIDLTKELDAADLAFLKSADTLRFFYLNGDAAPAAEAFVYSIIKES